MISKKYIVAVVALVIAGTSHASGVPVRAMEATLTKEHPEKEVVARYVAQQHTQITPRVTGYLSKQLVQDGAVVREGEPLFVIDDVEYRHNHELAKAQIKQAQATQATARYHYDRMVKLQGSGGSTQSELDIAKAQLEAANAAVQSAKIHLEKATYDLESTIVKAPYSGQLGKAKFHSGDMVSPAAGSLIDIVQLSPMNVEFTMDYNSYNAFELDDPSRSSVKLSDSDQETKINYIANKISPSSGTIIVSAEFDNSVLKVKPNFVTYVTLENIEEVQGYWVPLSALMQDMTIRYVYVIDEDSKAERRNVKIYSEKEGKAFITDGIKQGEQVITDGLIRVRPQAPVSVKTNEG